jgi:hypothetical protein
MYNQFYLLESVGIGMAGFQISTIALMLRARNEAAKPVMCIVQPSSPRSPSSLFTREDEGGSSVSLSSHLESKRH